MNFKSSVLVSFIGDPYVAIAFKKNYDKYWGKDIDEILIGVNSINNEFIEFINKLWSNDKKVKKINTYKNPIAHGSILNSLYPCSTGDVIITIDSDNYIIKENVIKENISNLNTFDVIGSTGLHVNQKQVMGSCVNNYGFVRLNPFLSFIKKDLIEKTDKNFDSMKKIYDSKTGLITDFNINEKEKEVIRFDTMSWLTYQMFFNKKINFKKIEQNEKSKWLHVSATSAATRLLFLNKEKTHLMDSLSKTVIQTKQKIKWLTWIYYLHNEYSKFYPFKEWNNTYYENLIELIKFSGFDENKVKNQMQEIKKDYGFNTLG